MTKIPESDYRSTVAGKAVRLAYAAGLSDRRTASFGHMRALVHEVMELNGHTDASIAREGTQASLTLQWLRCSICE